MNKAHALLFALMMMTVSLAGCFGGDDGDSNDETPNETLDDWQVHFAASSSDLPEFTICFNIVKTSIGIVVAFW